jgi:hypothetical protein
VGIESSEWDKMVVFEPKVVRDVKVVLHFICKVSLLDFEGGDWQVLIIWEVVLK